jgi:hypothetical protein
MLKSEQTKLQTMVWTMNCDQESVGDNRAPVGDNHPQVYLAKVTREGGHVRRCHTFQHLGEYSVGKHSYDALSLLLILHPGCSKNLMMAVLWHDVAERFVGDMPRPAAWISPELGEQYKLAESKARKLTKLPEPVLTSEEKVWLETVDLLEFWIWCAEQRQLGNSGCNPMLAKVARILWDGFDSGRFHEGAREFFKQYRTGSVGDLVEHQVPAKSGE